MPVEITSPDEQESSQPEVAAPKNVVEWLSRKPKWFWVVVIIAACVIGAVLQKVFFPPWRGRLYEEEQRRKAEQQRQTQTLSEAETKDEKSPLPASNAKTSSQKSKAND